MLQRKIFWMPTFPQLSLGGMIIRISFLILFFIIISACHTTNHPTQNLAKNDNDNANAVLAENKEDEANRKIKTAKINAQLGIAYLERNDVLRAKHKLLLALEQAPDIPESWYSMAYFLEATGNKTEANKYYLKALEITPQRGDAQNNYGTFLCREGFYKEAIQHFDLAVQDKNYLGPADAYENAGLCAMRIPNYTQAIYYFKRAVMQDPVRPVALFKLAEAYYDKGNYQTAQQKLKEYLTITQPTSQSLLLSIRINKKLAAEKQARLAVLQKQKSQQLALQQAKQKITSQKVALSKNKSSPSDSIAWSDKINQQLKNTYIQKLHAYVRKNEPAAKPEKNLVSHKNSPKPVELNKFPILRYANNNNLMQKNAYQTHLTTNKKNTNQHAETKKQYKVIKSKKVYFVPMILKKNLPKNKKKPNSFENLAREQLHLSKNAKRNTNATE